MSGRIARVAVVGLGGIAQASHLPAIAHVPNAELAGACDVDHGRRQAFADAHPDVPVTETVEELLSVSSPDIVTVATPPATHLDLATLAMQAGAWALVEKPLCRSLEEADRLITVQRETGTWCVTVSQFRYGSASRFVKDSLAEWRWGPVLAATAHTAWYRDDTYYAVPWRGRIDTELGGVTISQAHHLIDLTSWLLGPWASVMADTRTVARDIEVEDVSAAIVGFESGAVASVFSTVLSHRQHSALAVHCRDATIELSTLYEPLETQWTLTASGGPSVALPLEADPLPATHATQLAAMVDAWARGREPELTLAEERSMVELLTSIYRSAGTGQRVHPSEITQRDPYYYALTGATPGVDDHG